MNISFNPEDSTFSQMDTLKTWVSEKYQDRIKKVQEDVALEVAQNPSAMDFCKGVVNNEGDENFYGNTFPALPGIELPYLQYVNKISKIKEDFIGLEIAGGMGRAMWKCPIASGSKGTFYFNELSLKLNELFDEMMEKRLSNKQRKTIKKIPGNCFKVLDDLKGKVHVLLVENLEHFLTPEKHKKFVELISNLLAPNGKAFLAAHCLTPQPDEHPLTQHYNFQLEKGSIYPGFVKFDRTFLKIRESSGVLGQGEISNVTTPKDDEPTSSTVIKIEYSHNGFIKQLQRETEVYKITETVVAMQFKPDAIKKIYDQDPTLEVEDSYFMDFFGCKQDESDESSSHCATIIRKKTV